MFNGLMIFMTIINAITGIFFFLADHLPAIPRAIMGVVGLPYWIFSIFPPVTSGLSSYPPLLQPCRSRQKFISIDYISNQTEELDKRG